MIQMKVRTMTSNDIDILLHKRMLSNKYSSKCHTRLCKHNTIVNKIISYIKNYLNIVLDAKDQSTALVFCVRAWRHLSNSSNKTHLMSCRCSRTKPINDERNSYHSQISIKVRKHWPTLDEIALLSLSPFYTFYNVSSSAN